MNIINRFLCLSFIATSMALHAENIDIDNESSNKSLIDWQAIDTLATLATRLSHHDAPLNTGDYLSESTFIAEHYYQSLILRWRLNNALYQAPEDNNMESDSEFELSELSYSFSLTEDESDLWQIGKFNHPFDPGYALRSVGFFESNNNPFDDFASNEGLKMASASLWLGDNYFSLVMALEGATPASKDLKQWALVMQRDFDALSTNFMLQQYEQHHIGLGGSFTYVLGDSLEFHGSGFIRQGSVWRNQFKNSALQTIYDNEEEWAPKVVFGSFWTTTYLQLLLEYSYQKDKLSPSEIDSVKNIKAQSEREATDYRAGVTQLYQQAYQQHYLFAQAEYSIEDHTITANTLIGQDISALSQLKYEYLATYNLSAWLSMELASGTNDTEFARIPWQNRVQIGLQWKI